MDRSTRTDAQKKTGEVRNTSQTGRVTPRTGQGQRVSRKKPLGRRKPRSVLNWESSLYNDEIPDPECPELPDESDEREDRG